MSTSDHTYHGVPENHLIACLLAPARMLWDPHLKPIGLESGQVIDYSQCHPSYVSFPCTAIVSKLYILKDGASAEIAVVGNGGGR